MLYLQAEQFAAQWNSHHNDAALPDNREHFTLSLKDYKKDICGSNEISVFGKLYVVKSVAIFGEHVELQVINDVCDEEIVDEIVKTIKRTGPQDHKRHEPLLELLSLDYVCPESFILTPGFLPDRMLFGRHRFLLASESPEIPSPPPQLV